MDGGIWHNAQDTGGVAPASGQHQQGSEGHTLLSVGVGEPPLLHCDLSGCAALTPPPPPSHSNRMGSGLSDGHSKYLRAPLPVATMCWTNIRVSIMCRTTAAAAHLKSPGTPSLVQMCCSTPDTVILPPRVCSSNTQPTAALLQLPSMYSWQVANKVQLASGMGIQASVAVVGFGSTETA